MSTVNGKAFEAKTLELMETETINILSNHNITKFGFYLIFIPNHISQEFVIFLNAYRQPFLYASNLFVSALCN